MSLIERLYSLLADVFSYSPAVRVAALRRQGEIVLSAKTDNRYKGG
jgi:hypothetical protein